jgi:putative endonuclease
MTDKIETGVKGENLAADFLMRKGFEVVARNFRHNRGEIDLIIKRDDWLIFVEVKTRVSTAFAEPEHYVTDFKARKIYEAAEEYIFRVDWHGHVRFDVISIKLSDQPEIMHFEDAIN